MGKYDLDSLYSADIELTIAGLAREIREEEESTEGSTEHSFAEYEYNRIWHLLSGKTGLTGRLQEIGIFISPAQFGENCDKYDALKILKLFYKTENPESSKISKKYNIIQILKSHHLSNITVEYTQSTAYGTVFDEIYTALRAKVGQATEYERVLERIKTEWHELRSDLTKMIFRPAFIQSGDSALQVLGNLPNRLLQLLETVKKDAPPFPSKDIMNVTFLYFVRYKVLCDIAESLNCPGRARIPGLDDDKMLAAAFRSKFSENISSLISWDQINSMEKNIRKGNRDPNWRFFTALALGTVAKQDVFYPENRSSLVNAFQFAPTVAEWYSKKYDLNISDGLPPHVLFGILQTIYYVSVNKIQYTNNYYGNRVPKRSLLAAIKDHENADAAAITDIEHRITNQILMIIAGADMARAYRSIETALLKLAEAVVSEMTIDSIYATHNRLFPEAKKMIRDVTDLQFEERDITFAPFYDSAKSGESG